MLSLATKKLANLNKTQLSRLEIYKSLCLQIEVAQTDPSLSLEKNFSAHLRHLQYQTKQYSFRSVSSRHLSNQDAVYSWVEVNKILPDRRLLNYPKQHFLNLFQQIITIPQFPFNMETIFHPKQISGRIKLLQINLTYGPVYSILSGPDRVGACYLAGLQQVPCEVIR